MSIAFAYYFPFTRHPSVVVVVARELLLAKADEAIKANLRRHVGVFQSWDRRV